MRYHRWLLGVALLTACGPRVEATVIEAMPDGDVVAEGQKLYEKYCKLCHAEAGRGYASDNANQLANPEFLSTASDAFLMLAVDQGHPGTPMGAYGESFGGPLSHVDERKLVLYLRSLQTKPTAKLVTGAAQGDVARGATIFQEQCSSCHGDKAQGVSAVSLNNPVFLLSASDGYLRYAIEHGRTGTPMPAFQGEFVPQTIEDVTSFLRSLARNVESAPRGEVPPSFENAVIHPSGPDPNFPALREGRFLPAAVVKEALEKGAKMVLLDARPTSEWLNSHIPGALPVPYYDPDRMTAKLPRDGTWILAYCGCPHAASGHVVDTLRGQGFPRTAVIDEGVFEWVRRGYPITYGRAQPLGAPP